MCQKTPEGTPNPWHKQGSKFVTLLWAMAKARTWHQALQGEKPNDARPKGCLHETIKNRLDLSHEDGRQHLTWSPCILAETTWILFNGCTSDRRCPSAKHHTLEGTLWSAQSDCLVHSKRHEVQPLEAPGRMHQNTKIKSIKSPNKPKWYHIIP